MPADLRPGHSWHHLLARVVRGGPATLHGLEKEARSRGRVVTRRELTRKLAAAAEGLVALGLLEKHGAQLHPTQAAEPALAALDAKLKEDA